MSTSARTAVAAASPRLRREHFHRRAIMASQYLTPFVVPGYEPPAPDPETGEVRIKTEDERREIMWQMKQVRMVQDGMESPVAKAAISGAMGELWELRLVRGQGG